MTDKTKLAEAIKTIIERMEVEKKQLSSCSEEDDYIEGHNAAIDLAFEIVKEVGGGKA